MSSDFNPHMIKRGNPYGAFRFAGVFFGLWMESESNASASRLVVTVASAGLDHNSGTRSPTCKRG